MPKVPSTAAHAASAWATAFVGGVWHQRRTGNKLALTVELLRDLAPSQRRALEDQVALVGAVMQASPDADARTCADGATRLAGVEDRVTLELLLVADGW